MSVINRFPCAGVSSGTYQAKTVTPSASQQVVSPDAEYDALSSVTVNGDADLTAGNIKNDVTIFDVTGTLTVPAISLAAGVLSIS